MKSLLIFLLLIFPIFVLAKSESDSLGGISGAVFTADGQPAAYVSVLIKNAKKGIITDVDGKFDFKKIKAGNYILSVSLLDCDKSSA